MRLFIVLSMLIMFMPYNKAQATGHLFFDSNCMPKVKDSVIVIYKAKWCGYCGQYAKYYKSKKFNYVVIDVDEDQSTCKQRVKVLPTTLLFKDRKYIGGFVGFEPRKLDLMIEEM